MNIKMVVDNDKYRPTYANTTDYCMDVKVRLDNEEEVINPSESKVFGTGIKVAIPEGWGLFLLPRSSTGFKLSCRLANTIGMVDAGYRDEIKVKVNNFGNIPVSITDGQRLFQMFILPKYQIEPTYVEDNEDFRSGDRGGGIGSTGV